MEADLYLTGEFGHHHILDALSFGRSVIVCNHSNTERGYLKELKRLLEEKLGDGYELVVSKVDRDPLTVFSSVCPQTTKQQNKQINLCDGVLFFPP